MISIIIPLYNKEHQIRETLESVFKQTFQDFEIVIVNDGSTDKSTDIVKEFLDDRIRLIHQANQGVSVARNRGIEEARYKYIALLDADDEWRPDYLQTQIELIDKYTECSVFACAYEFRSKEKTTLLILNKMPFEGETGILSNYFEVASCSHPPICSINIVAKKQAFLSVGGFPEGVASGEDLITWAKLAVKYQIAYSLKSLAIFISSNSTTGISKSEERFEEKDEVLHGLIALYQESTDKRQKKHLKEYILRWYRIQCVILLEINRGKDCVKKAFEAMLRGGSIVVFGALIVLGCLPKQWAMSILRKKD